MYQLNDELNTTEQVVHISHGLGFYVYHKKDWQCIGLLKGKIHSQVAMQNISLPVTFILVFNIFETHLSE